MISDNFPSPRSCRDCFWIITSSSINITMINPKSSLFCLVSFAPPIVKSVSAVSRQSLGSLSAAKSTSFHFQSENISICYLLVLRTIYFDSKQHAQKQKDHAEEKRKTWKGDRRLCLQWKRKSAFHCFFLKKIFSVGVNLFVLCCMVVQS